MIRIKAIPHKQLTFDDLVDEKGQKRKFIDLRRKVGPRLRSEKKVLNDGSNRKYKEKLNKLNLQKGSIPPIF